MQDEDAQVVLHVLVEDQPAAEVHERGRRRDARVRRRVIDLRQRGARQK